MPAFEAKLKEFEAANTQVLGISTDSIFCHEAWAKSLGGISYPLLGDVHREVAKQYGVWWPERNASYRATFIVDKHGKVRLAERYGKGEIPDTEKILAEVQKLR